MKNIYLLGLLAIPFLSNCSNEEMIESVQPVKGNYTIDATIGQTEARTVVTADFKVNWTTGDCIGVYGQTSTNLSFALSEGAGSANGRFTGTIEKDAPVFAYYPYAAGTSLSEKTLTMTLPAQYAYTANSNGPMIAKYNPTNNSLSFKHLCGLLKVTVNDIPATATKFVLEGSDDIAGTGTVADIDAVDAALSVSASGSKTVTVTLSEAAASSKSFYFPLPVGTYTSLSISLLDKDNVKLYTRSVDNIQIERAKAIDMPAVSTTPWDGVSRVEPKKDNEVYQITSAAELAWFQRTKEDAVKANVTPTMTADAVLCNDIDLNNKPWMGIVLATGKTFDGGNHTISNLKVEAYSLEEQSNVTTRACAGFFSTTLGSSTVKDVTLEKVNIAVEAKWCGALIGHSYSSTVSGCTVKNVTVGKATNSSSPTHYSYRMGGLIGYVDCTSDVAITDCHVEAATITGAYALGGLLGTTMWAYDVTVTNCSVKNISLVIDQPALKSIASPSNGEYEAYIGYNGMMVGSVQQTSDKKLTFDKCSIDASITAETRIQWLCSELKDALGRVFAGGNSWIGRVGGVDLTNGKAQIILQNSCKESSTSADKTFTEGVDYNVYTGNATGNGDAEDYIKNDGSWKD